MTPSLGNAEPFGEIRRYLLLGKNLCFDKNGNLPISIEPSSLRATDLLYCVSLTLTNRIVIRLSIPMTRVCFLTIIILSLVKPATSQQLEANFSVVGRYYWGYSDELILDNDILYITTSGRIVSADVSVPAKPVFLDTLDWRQVWTGLDECTGLAINDDLLYGATTRNGIFVLDVSDPANMRVVNRIEFNLNWYRITALHLHKSFLVAVQVDSLFVFDVSYPSSPARRQEYELNYRPNISRRVPLEFTDSLFYIQQNDFSPTSLDEIHVLRILPDGTLTKDTIISQDWEELDAMSMRDSIMFIGSDTYLKIYRIVNMYDFQPLSNLEVPWALTRFSLSGDLLYAISSFGVLYVIDISDILQPKIIGEYDDDESIKFYALQIIEDYIYITTVGGGLLVLNMELNTVNVPPSSTATSFSLSPAYPNPLYAGTPAQVRFSLPTTGYVTLTLHDALGRELRRISKRVDPGEHLESLATAGLPPGVYYYSILASGQKKTEMLVVR